MLIASGLLAFIGLAVSGYLVLLKQRLAADKEYKSVCDISEIISCSAPMKSEYGNLFGPENGIIGVIFYTVVLLLSLLHYPTLVLLAALAAVAVSIYLAYILYFKIRVLCPLCTVIYAVNILLLISAWYGW